MSQAYKERVDLNLVNWNIMSTLALEIITWHYEAKGNQNGGDKFGTNS